MLNADFTAKEFYVFLNFCLVETSRCLFVSRITCMYPACLLLKVLA